MKIKFAHRLSIAVLTALTLVAGTVNATAAGEDATVAHTALGKVVVDGKGMTAYYFDSDVANSGTSACAGPCA